jgi:hypothetical protein
MSEASSPDEVRVVDHADPVASYTFRHGDETSEPVRTTDASVRYGDGQRFGDHFVAFYVWDGDVHLRLDRRTMLARTVTVTSVASNPFRSRYRIAVDSGTSELTVRYPGAVVRRRILGFGTYDETEEESDDLLCLLSNSLGHPSWQPHVLSYWRDGVGAL